MVTIDRKKKSENQFIVLFQLFFIACFFIYNTIYNTYMYNHDETFENLYRNFTDKIQIMAQSLHNITQVYHFCHINNLYRINCTLLWLI